MPLSLLKFSVVVSGTLYPNADPALFVTDNGAQKTPSTNKNNKLPWHLSSPATGITPSNSTYAYMSDSGTPTQCAPAATSPRRAAEGAAALCR